MTKNKIFLNADNIVEIHVIGNQTHDSVMAMGKESEVLLQELASKNLPGLVLDNITEMGETDTAARQAVSKLARTLPYKKVAMYGSNAVAIRVGSSLLLQAIGMGSKIKYFGVKSKAVDWLKK